MSQEQEATGPGIVVLSSSLQVLHMNRRAKTLLTQLERTTEGAQAERGGNGSLQQPCQDILQTLPARLTSNNWEQFQDRTIGNSRLAIFMKRFDRPDLRSQTHSRIVILLSLHTPMSRPGTSDRESSPFLARVTSLARKRRAWLRINHLPSA
jgi:hypothetical protein